MKPRQIEESVVLRDELVVAVKGYQWTEGSNRGEMERFLVSREPIYQFKKQKLDDVVVDDLSADGFEVQSWISQSPALKSRGISPELYLEFEELKPNTEEILAFANRYGELGSIETHFHRDARTLRGEAERDWGREIRSFKEYFNLWRLIEEGRSVELQRFMRSPDWKLHLLDEPGLRQDRIRWAKYGLMKKVNEKLFPVQGACESCAECQKPLYQSRACVTYGLRLFGDGRLRTHALADTLLASIWLQFAEVIAGGRTIRRCEVCLKWMDITDSERKGSKRMHPACSQRDRMKRHREKLQAGDL